MKPIVTKTDEARIQNYIKWMAEQCGADKINLPQGFMQNFRGWEFFECLSAAEICSGDVILDTGALHTFGCIYLSQYASKVYTTDNFYWATRDYAKKIMTVDQWKTYVEKKSRRIVAEDADLMKVQYADNSMDAVFCISTLEHVVDDVAALREMLRIVRPARHVCLTVEYNQKYSKPYSEADGSYYRIYNADDVSNLVNKVSDLGNVTRIAVQTEESRPGLFTPLMFRMTKRVG